MTDKSKPAQAFSIGPVQAAIWKNNSKNGDFYSVTFSRSYKSGESFKNSDTFSNRDLLSVSKLADQAHSWILAQ